MNLKTRVLLLLILIALASLTNGQSVAAQSQTPPAVSWTRYTYSGEEFSAELPGMPWVFRTWRSTSDDSHRAEKTRVVGLYHNGVVYLIVSFDNPLNTESDDRLANYVWGGGGLTRKGEVKSGGVTGREYEYDISLHNIKGAARLFRTKKRAYLLQALSNTEGYREAFEHFLNSITFGAKPAGALIADDPRASAAEGDGPYKSSELVQKVVLVYKPEPGFTEEARQHNVSGVVRLRAVLTSSGKVTDISVVKGLPDGLTERAIAAARRILFFPARKDGREVSQYVVLEYNFNFY